MYTIRLNGHQSFLMVTPPKSPPRILTFKEREQADKCKDYISFYRKKYGKWPGIDMTRGVETVHRPGKKDHRDPRRLSSIEYMEHDELMEMCQTFNIGFLECLDFQHIPGIRKDQFLINLTGREFHYESNHEKYLKKLEELIDIVD